MPLGFSSKHTQVDIPKKIAKLTEELDIADVTKEKALEALKDASFKEISEELWKYYCFVCDIKSALMELEDGKIDNAETVEAISNADYENRLKADMIAILEDLKKEMNPIKECEYQIYGKEHWNFVGKCQNVIQQKINALKENKNENEKN